LSACANVPFGRCLCGKAAQTGRIVESMKKGEDHHITYDGIAPHGHYCSPILAGDKTIGVLNLYLKEGVSLTDSQRRFIKSVADILAESILHAQTEEKLAQSQKMEAVGLLAGGVAHDFNNILTAIKGYGELVSNALLPEDPKREDMREIMNAAERATTLTRQLLAFSRRQVLSPSIVDLNGIVGGMTNMLQRIIGEDIKLSTKLKSLPCPVMVDAGQIEQVVMNLVINSRDAMPKGGRITLETDFIAASDESAAAHPELARGPLACLTVRDTGCGMTEEVKEHAFEPFYTTKEQGKGTGLGLSMIYGIVKQSGGEIKFESAPGNGTAFFVWLPLVGTPLPESAGVMPRSSPGKASETILFVEDEESLRRLGERVLRAKGYTVIPASNGEEALAALERHGKPVDLLVTDVVMPGMSGHELAKEVARGNMAGRILYMSGYTEDAITKHGVLEPGLAFIYKPFTIDALALKLREVLDGPADKAKA
jgi:signal transduction histidine kinase/ActR/RegA family two-component response regulator